jgi:hypothetical protein
LDRFLATFAWIAPAVRAGEKGWSVILTLEALERALMMDGRAVPVDMKDAAGDQPVASCS